MVKFYLQLQVGRMAQVGFFVAYRRHWRAKKADLWRRTCREKQTCARDRIFFATYFFRDKNGISVRAEMP